MSIKLAIAIDALKNEAVARALSDLLVAVGKRVQEGLPENKSIPGVLFELNAGVPEADFTSIPMPKKRGRRPMSPEEKEKARELRAKNREPKLQGKIAKAAGNATRDFSKMSESERYDAFFAQLPERSQQFLELVRTRKTLRIEEAMEALNLKVGKALGGLTGSIARWAPLYGVRLPYQIFVLHGSRAWRWIGPQFDRKSSAPKVDVPPMNDLFELQVELSSSSHDFLKFLKKNGKVTTLDLMHHFKLRSVSSLLAIIEPVDRLIEKRGMSPLYKVEGESEEERTYIWNAD